MGVPDLIAVKGKKTVALDVTIWFETLGTTLYLAGEVKRTKYQSFVSTIMRPFPGVECVMVQDFPVGAQRKWHGPNQNILKRLGVNKTRQLWLAEVISRRMLFTIDLCKFGISLGEH